MSKVKRFIDVDVYVEAKKRIKHILSAFDKVYVCFSGGKDSLVVLHLVQDVYNELGIKEKVNVIFRDEELIPDDVINFVQDYCKSGRYNFYYYAVQLKSTKFILGKTHEYIQWDSNRTWLRDKPDFAITDKLDRVFDQYSMDAYCVDGVKGKIAFLTGIRADESLVRLQSCLVKKNENYINATQSKNVKLCKPIYDWSEKDVFKYFYDNDIKYCYIYDLQAVNDDNYRVSTPLHAENSKKFYKLKSLYPVFYQQIVDIFPEMIVQEKYWRSLDRESIIYQYEHSFDGIYEYIKTIEDPNQRKLATERVEAAQMNRENKINDGTGKHNFGGYPLLYVFKTIVAGQYKRVIQPKPIPTRKDIEYERE